MSTRDSKSLVSLYYLAVSQGQLDLLDAHVAPEFAHHTPGLPPGWIVYKHVLHQYRAGFHDMTTSVQRLLADGDCVVAHTLTRGTHRGAFLGHAPTGSTFAAPGIDIFRVESGRLVERWGVFDTLTMLQQLGLYQPVGAGAAPARTGVPTQ